MSVEKPEISIPILTQIIAPSSTGGNTAPQKPVPAEAAPGGAPKSVTPMFASQMVSAAGTVQGDARSEASADVAPSDDWKMLELKLNERVLRQILRRVDFVIEHRVKESLAEVLQATTDALIKDIRRGLHVTLEDIIKRAVAQEIARVQSVKE
jgi:hypothetical protein